jgi:hypothetical protein
MTKAELQEELDRTSRDLDKIAKDYLHKCEIIRLHERYLSLIEKMNRTTNNYWSGS